MGDTEAGGTGHTKPICRQPGVLVIFQRVWSDSDRRTRELDRHMLISRFRRGVSQLAMRGQVIFASMRAAGKLSKTMLPVRRSLTAAYPGVETEVVERLCQSSSG